MEGVKKYLRIILNIIIPLTGLYLVCVWGPRVLGFFIPFVIGWMIALIANPLVRFLEKRLKIVRKHGSMLIIAGVLALIISLLYFVLGKAYVEIREFIGDLPALYDSAAAEIRGAVQNGNRMFEFLPDEFRTAMQPSIFNIYGLPKLIELDKRKSPGSTYLDFFIPSGFIFWAVSVIYIDSVVSPILIQLIPPPSSVIN